MLPQVRLLATNLSLEDVLPVRDKLADALFAGEGTLLPVAQHQHLHGLFAARKAAAAFKRSLAGMQALGAAQLCFGRNVGTCALYRLLGSAVELPPSFPSPLPPCPSPAAIPVGVGSEGSLVLRAAEMDKLLSRGMGYVQELGLCWPEDRAVTEETVRAHSCLQDQLLLNYQAERLRCLLALEDKCCFCCECPSGDGGMTEGELVAPACAPAGLLPWC